MIRNLNFKDGLVVGEVKDIFISIFPKLKGSFIQRKQYDEYLFNETEIELDIDKLSLISNQFTYIINKFDIIILN